MNIETTSGSLLEQLKNNPKFHKLPESLKNWCIETNINDEGALADYLCVKAQTFLKSGAKQSGSDILELANELASEAGDDELAAQINAWLGLLETEENELVLETIEAIRGVIEDTDDYKEFERTVLGNNNL